MYYSQRWINSFSISSVAALRNKKMTLIRYILRYRTKTTLSFTVEISLEFFKERWHHFLKHYKCRPSRMIQTQVHLSSGKSYLWENIDKCLSIFLAEGCAHLLIHLLFVLILELIDDGDISDCVSFSVYGEFWFRAAEILEKKKYMHIF